MKQHVTATGSGKLIINTREQHPDGRYPSLGEMARNAAESLVSHVRTGLKKADEDTCNIRWEHCTSCEKLKDGKRCVLCGCYMKIKSTWAEQKCPLDKW